MTQRTARIYRDLNGLWVLGYYAGDQPCDWRGLYFSSEAEAAAKAKEIGVTQYFVGYSNTLKEIL